MGTARGTAAAGTALASQAGEATRLLGSFHSLLAAVWLLFPITGIIKMIFFFQWVFPGLLWKQTLFSLYWSPALCFEEKDMGVQGCPTKPELERVSLTWKSPSPEEFFCESRSWGPHPFYLRQPQLSSLSSPKQPQVRGRPRAWRSKCLWASMAVGSWPWHSHSCSFAHLHSAAQLWSTVRVLSPPADAHVPPLNPKRHHSTSP